MANAYSSAGLKVKYAVEATAGTFPTSGYTYIPGVKAVPPTNTDINTAQSTPLEAEVNHTYIRLLGDSGGAVQLTVNDYPAFRTAWEACLTAYAGLTGGKQMWFEYAYPPNTGMESYYFCGEPAPLGFGGADVDEVLENMASIIPTGQAKFATAST